MKTCHYDGPDAWAPCEQESELTCKQCGYCWDDDDFREEEEEMRV